MDLGAALRSAGTVNETVRYADEATCLALLAAERAGKRRLVPLLRIHSRLNRLRAVRERSELRRLAREG
jgi:hypothetical protein